MDDSLRSREGWRNPFGMDGWMASLDERDGAFGAGWMGI
jgi:hypothetical protein